ncbi:MAG: hypothetical protein Q8K35_07315 [Thiobacillus sp.]|nr:hypothetical protein [Thiobacillus sp.]MDP2057553.1 hypothetical protein [Thiobacillus sp.]
MRAQLETKGRCGGAVVIDGFSAYPQCPFAVFAAHADTGFVDLGKHQNPFCDPEKGFCPVDFPERFQGLIDLLVNFGSAGCVRQGRSQEQGDQGRE